jgi:hypothetical protein
LCYNSKSGGKRQQAQYPFFHDSNLGL